MNCVCCLYWWPSPEEGSPLGFCRRHAPRPQVGYGPCVNDVRWPVTEEDDFCGEFVRPSAVAAAQRREEEECDGLRI